MGGRRGRVRAPGARPAGCHGLCTHGNDSAPTPACVSDCRNTTTASPRRRVVCPPAHAAFAESRQTARSRPESPFQHAPAGSRGALSKSSLMGRPSAHARCLGSPLTPLGLRLCGPKAVTKFAAPGGGTAKDWATVAGSSRPTSPLASAKGDPRKEKVLLDDSLRRRESALPAGPVALLASSLPQ